MAYQFNRSSRFSSMKGLAAISLALLALILPACNTGYEENEGVGEEELGEEGLGEESLGGEEELGEEEGLGEEGLGEEEEGVE